MNPETTVVVLTAIDVETRAVLERLVNVRPGQVGETALHLGEFGAFTIVVVEVGAGNVGAASVATTALNQYKPSIAAFVGIAGGVKDVAVGDVVVATKVYGYESGKEYSTGFRPRPEVRSSSQALVSRARVIRQGKQWQRQPKVFVAPIAAGEVVVGTDRGRIAELIQQNYGDALAIEMEGRGFLEAVHTTSGCDGVVVRGISDLLSGKAEAEAQGSQARAAEAAAAFFFAMLDFKTSSPDPKVLRPAGGTKKNRQGNGATLANQFMIDRLTERRRVFISYSKDSAKQEDRVLRFAYRLQADGIEPICDQYGDPPDNELPLWCEEQIRKADFVLMVCTTIYNRRFVGAEKRNEDLRDSGDAKLISNYIYHPGPARKKFIPVLMASEESPQLPMILADLTAYSVNSQRGYKSLLRRLTDQPKHNPPPITGSKP